MQAACAEVLAVYEDQQKPFSIELLEVKSCKLVKAVLWDDEVCFLLLQRRWVDPRRTRRH
jgi:hypothetical protein